MSLNSAINWRKKNPLRSAYNDLKSNSKKRGKQFELTFDQFKEFCIECTLIYKNGKRKKGFEIDRKENDKGYTIDNIQKLSKSENILKYHNYDRFTRQLNIELDNTDLPF